MTTEEHNQSEPRPSALRRLLAWWWLVWGQSISYWAGRLSDRTLYNWAVGSYSRALIARPDCAQAYYLRGMLRGRELDDYAGAVRDLTQAAELRPDWPAPYLQRGLLHRFHSSSTAWRAIEDLERFLALGGDPAWSEEARYQIERLRAEIQERDSSHG